MKVTERIEAIDGTMARCYVYRNGKDTVLFDAGTRGSGRRVVEYFRRLGQQPTHVLITHYHPDHIGGLRDIEEAFSPEIYCSPLEIAVVAGREKMTPSRSILSRLVASLSSVKPVTSAKDFSKLEIEGITLLETPPGHTPGSTSFIVEGEKAIVVGDAVYTRNGRLEVNRTFTLDMQKAEESRKKIMQYKGYTVLPGHGGETVTL
ncbi:MBL fold metallo-hydrolase [Thermogymnomonas acidicola]|uniref:MBL fold metallo-hydrolase n=1 Tax=Thermogymnomonas acidicola TaxID=399579 RepID=UPI00094684A3|nr:MBL fold metallo-hydrolase [Thermogymnomonas acidicola]